MADHNPLDAVYSFIERAYVRLQAGDLIFRCLEVRGLNPLQSWIESLVLAGPQNLEVFREILEEVVERKAQSAEDLEQVIHNFENNLQSYGVKVADPERPLALSQLTAARFLSLIVEQGVTEQKNQVACLELLRDTRDLISTLNVHTGILREIETYLKDWMWGLVYESAHQVQAEEPNSLVI